MWPMLVSCYRKNFEVFYPLHVIRSAFAAPLKTDVTQGDYMHTGNDSKVKIKAPAPLERFA